MTLNSILKCIRKRDAHFQKRVSQISLQVYKNILEILFYFSFINKCKNYCLWTAYNIKTSLVGVTWTGSDSQTCLHQENLL